MMMMAPSARGCTLRAVDRSQVHFSLKYGRVVAVRASNAADPASSTSEAPSRRAALAGLALLAGLRPSASLAEEAAAPVAAPSSTYSDEQDGFTIAVPAGWVQGSGAINEAPEGRSRFSNAAGLQRVVAWTPPEGGDASVAVTSVTPGADYTSLGSFGSAQDFGENMIASMDRSYMMRQPGWAKQGQPVVTASLVSAAEKGGRYVIEYLVGKDGEPTRRVVSAVSMGMTPRGLRRFYTVNGTCTEDQVEQYSALLRQAVESFAVPR